MATYYMNAGDAAIADPLAKWTNPANAADGNTATSATCSSAATSSAEYIGIDGSTAPSSGGTISQVRGRTFTGTTGAYGTYITLTAPASGWTWAAVQHLETRTHYDIDISVKMKTNFYADTTSGGTSLGLVTGGATGNSLYRIEIEVTTTHTSIGGGYVSVGNGMSRSEVAN